jgi:cob(I)alamin adenosyltransferase
MTEKQIINPSFSYGKGDNGMTQAKNKKFLAKHSMAVRFYSEFEIWVKCLALVDEHLYVYNCSMKPSVSAWLINNDRSEEWYFNRVAMFKDILVYLKANSYVLGALAFTEDESWSLDSDLLGWMRQEIKQMEGVAHNFVTPDVSKPDLLYLEELRLQTRKLESFLSYTIDLPNVNSSIINRFSSYTYIFLGLLRTSRGEALNQTDWSMERQPKFQPLAAEANSNNE